MLNIKSPLELLRFNIILKGRLFAANSRWDRPANVKHPENIKDFLI